MPPSRPGTIPRFNTPCVLPRHTGLPKCRDGLSTRKARTSASFITRPTGRYHCSFMEAAKTSWVSGIREQTRGPRILPTMPSYPRRKFGPGVLTRRVLIGAKRSPTTTAPTSSCKRGSSKIRRRMRSLNRGSASLSRNIGCLSAIQMGSPGRILQA